MRTSEALRQEDRLSTVGSFDSCSGGEGRREGVDGFTGLMRFVFMVLECMAGLQNGGQGSMLPMEKIFLFQKRKREEWSWKVMAVRTAQLREVGWETA